MNGAGGGHGGHEASSSNKLGFTRTNFQTRSRSRSPEDHRTKQLTDASSSCNLNGLAKSIYARSQGALPTVTRANGKSRSRSASGELSEPGSPAQKKFKTTLQQYRYDGPGASENPVISLDDDDDEDLSDLSDLSAQDAAFGEMLAARDPPKTRRFVRGGPKAQRRAADSSDVEEVHGPQQDTPRTSISANEEDDSLLQTANRIRRIRPEVTLEDAKHALLRCNRDVTASLKFIDQQRGATVRKVRVIPDSPASVSSSPYVPNGQASLDLATPSSSPTKSMIKSNTNKLTAPKGNGIHVTKKTVSVPRNSSSPVALARPFVKKGTQDASQVKNNAIKRVKDSHRSARSSPSDDELRAFSMDDSSDGDGNDFDHDRGNERKALQWFNQNDAKQLVDVVGVTAAQAQTIIDLRPFRSTDDLTSKLNSAKGVQPRMFYNCVDLMSGLQRIDSVLEKCEKMGRKLSAALSRWDAKSADEDPKYLHQQPPGAADDVLLRDFQLYGVNWLYLLYRTKCSGILADDMGLGKTAQVISFLNQIVHQDERRPHLIVVPSSVLTNWMREFETFGSGLRVFKYHGPQKERVGQQIELKSYREEYDVVITTYDMASGADRDHSFLRKYEFDSIIYDEGHVLKNQKSVKYGKLMRLRAEWRLLLTGTPLQNNLGELISLLKFIMPTYFRGAEEALSQIFQVSHQTQLSKERITRAKQMMRPFVLRRKKIDVLDNLKSKTELVKYCDMTEEQSKLYRVAFAKSRAALLEQQEREAANGNEDGSTAEKRKKGVPSQAVKSGHVLMELRKAANHPLLFRRLYDDKKIDALARDYLKVAEHATEDLTEKKEDFAINSDAELCMSIAMQYPECKKHKLAPDEWLNSGKIAALKEVIDEAKARGERLIIFSQFVQTLEIICRALEVMQITYRGFTGSTDVNSRQEIVDEFTREESITCFLLSTRAGGVGINLTAANWVVLFDQDFNPQNDRQAADRCYRIGQEKAVTIVRLISRDTIDEQIFELGKSKLKLAERVQGQNDADEDDEGEEAGANTQEEMEKKMEKSLLAGILAGVDKDA